MQSFMSIICFVFKIQAIKNGRLLARKVFGIFEKRAPAGTVLKLNRIGSILISSTGLFTRDRPGTSPGRFQPDPKNAAPVLDRF